MMLARRAVRPAIIVPLPQRAQRSMLTPQGWVALLVTVTAIAAALLAPIVYTAGIHEGLRRAYAEAYFRALDSAVVRAVRLGLVADSVMRERANMTIAAKRNPVHVRLPMPTLDSLPILLPTVPQ